MIALAEFLSSSFTASMLVKATLLLIAGGVVATAARNAGAATRHAILAITLATVLALPLGMIAIPSWKVTMLPAPVAQPLPTNSIAQKENTPSPPSIQDIAPIAASTPTSTVVVNRSTTPWISLLWATGALAVLLWMTIGRLSLYRISQNATRLDDDRWQRILDEEKVVAGVEKSIPLLASSGVSTPLTWGIRAPAILLPIEANDWTDAHRTVVLRHELAHIARGDSLTQMLAGMTCALYWFHPLVWVAARKLRAEQELACDDRVLTSGTPSTEYAAHLLEVARSARALGAHGLVSLAMARPSQLEGRLLAVLNNSRPRKSPSPVMRFAGVAVAVAALIGLSAFRPMPRAMIRTVTAPTILAAQFVAERWPVIKLPDVTILATNSDARSVLDSIFDKTVDVQTDGTLVLDLNTGASLNITGWDEPRVRVSGTLGGRSWRESDVILERTSSGASLISRYHGRSSDQSFRNHFDVSVPRRFNIRLSSAGGGVTIRDVNGDFSGNTGGGEITLDRAGGHAELHTGGGRIHVTASNLSGTVTTGGGVVTIDNKGGLMAHSGSGPVVYLGNDSIGEGVGDGRSYSGDGRSSSSNSVSMSSSSVTVDDATGEIRENRTGRIAYRKAGGGINLAEAMHGADVGTGGGIVTIGRTGGDVQVHTGGGDVSIGPSTGDLTVSTGGGNIRLGPLDGSAVATTGKGDIAIRLNGPAGHTVNVSSGTGRVTLVVPANFSGVLDLETAYTERNGRTRIVSDWPVPITETNYWDATHGTPRKFVRARQTIGGGGAVLRVRTVNGDVIVQRR